jgi:acetyl esterase/lipase
VILDGARTAIGTFGGGIVISGESAGAHLAAVTLLRLKARGLADRIAGAALTYGVFDLRMTPSMANWGPDNLILSTPVVEWFVDNLTAGDRALRADPALSPLLADLSGLPPSLLTCGTADPLIDDTLFMAARLAAAGVAVETRIVPGGCHGFDLFDLAIAREHHAALAGFARARLDAAAENTTGAT